MSSETYRCLECGYDMGSSTRQLCGKTQCDYLGNSFVEEHSPREEPCNEDEEKYLEDDFEDNPKRYLFTRGEYFHINDIIESGIQFETMNDMFNWRLQKLDEISSWPGEEQNNFEFPFLVCKNAKRFMCPAGCIFNFSRFLDD